MAEKDDLQKLWQAANDQCALMFGEFLDDDFMPTDEDPYPPLPDDVIGSVVDYLKGTA